MRVLFFIFLFFQYLNVWSQKKYDVFLLGDYTDSVAIDTSLNWYVCHLDKSDPAVNKRRFVPIDVHKDLVYKSDSDRYSIRVDTSLHINGWILIGTSNTLTTNAYNESDRSFILQIGDWIELYPQGFRDCSPYVNLLITGEATENGWLTDIKKHQLTVGCLFTEYAYYKRYQEQHYKSFTQDINKLILPVLKRKKIKYSYLFLKAYIDNDEYYDLVLYVHGMYFLLLSEQHDFKHKKLYHIEKAFKDERIMEF